jgi:methylmalonyl-CoA mutase N-terminal domain/subunit
MDATIRMFASFGSAEETNSRFKRLLDDGQTGLSIAFDMPTLMGYDPDDDLAAAADLGDGYRGGRAAWD